jgi:DNA-binding transcriptional ArsR family regulator
MSPSGFPKVLYVLPLVCYWVPLVCFCVAGASKVGAKLVNVPFQPMRTWAFLTSHTRVLLAVAQNPELRVGEIADAAHVTERSAYRILSDLVEAGYLRRTREGRRNRYELDHDLPLGDPIVEEQPTSDLLSLIAS